MLSVLFFGMSGSCRSVLTWPAMSFRARDATMIECCERHACADCRLKVAKNVAVFTTNLLKIVAFSIVYNIVLVMT